jgi:hypothetical protein
MRPLLHDVMFQGSLSRFVSLLYSTRQTSRASWGKAQKTAERQASRESRGPTLTSNNTLLHHHLTHSSPVNHISHRLTNTCNHVSLHSWSSQRRLVQARLPKVRFPSKPQSDQQMLTTPLATTQRMAPSFATSTHAVPSPRPFRLRSVPMAATRSSSTTCRK